MISDAWNPYESWYRRHLNDSTIWHMEDMFEKDFAAPRVPQVSGFDTETNGLHIKKHTPFLIIFGWFVSGKQNGRVFTFEPTPRSMEIFFRLAKKFKIFMAWNTKYDLHMLTNIGWRYEEKNLFEGIALARLTVEAVPSRQGGISMQLKEIGEEFVHPLASQAEDKIREIKKQIKAQRVKVLAQALKQFPLPGQYTATGKQKMWGKKAVEDFLKDIINEPEDLPEEVRELYEDWKNEFEDGEYEPTYKDIYEEDPVAMVKYAGDDVITMLEFYRKAVPIVLLREQKATLKRENDLILPLYRMERVGIAVDRPYLEESRLKLKNVIKEKRHRMWELAGQEFSIGQHDLIKKIFLEKWGIELVKTLPPVQNAPALYQIPLPQLLF